MGTWKTIKRLLSYFKGHTFSFIIVVICSVLSTAFTVLAPAVIGQITTILYDGIKNGGNFNVEGIVLSLVTLIMLYVVGQVFALVTNFAIAKLSSKTMEKLRAEIDKKMHFVKLDYYDTHTHGELLSTITNDVETINIAFTEQMASALTEVFKAIGILVVMLILNPWLALIAVISVPVSLGVSKGVLFSASKQYNQQQELIGELNGYIEENYNGAQVVQSFNYQERAIGNFSEINGRLQDCAEKAETSAGTVRPLITVVNNAGFIVSAVIGSLKVIGGVWTLGNVQAMLQYISSFSEPFNTLSGMVGSFSAAIAAAGRVFKLLDAEEEIPNPEAPLIPETNKGTVEFRHVAFGYTPDRMLMKDVNITVKPGMKVAVVGPTGAGKTTLINLLMRFYEINGGEIYVDGVKTTEMTREELRDRFGMVLQDTWLFEGTIMDNLKYGSARVTEDDVYEASKTAGTEKFIKTFPNGYQMVLSKGAENISQGERQMLTIVRAMATNPEIMILDEATSNVDTHTELMIQTAMAKLMQGRTSFVIAHRLSTIKDANMILYMEQGDIKEAGSHDELMAMHGKYEALYNSQFAN